MAEASKYTGADKAMADLKALREFAPKEFGRALRAETEVEVPECKALAPWESGDMRDEIHAEGPFQEGNKIRCTISTGEKSADYALIQHEDLDLDHPRGGEAKFIEKPLRQSASSMPARVAAQIDLKRYK